MQTHGDAPPEPGGRIAVIGAGLAGLLSAELLSRRYRVSLFEAGGDLCRRTVDVALDGQTWPVDVGLPRFNAAASPKLSALLESLGAGTMGCPATLGVSFDAGRLEWADTGIDALFAQRRRLLSPAFFGRLADARHFRWHAERLRLDAIVTRFTMAQLLAQTRYGRAFRDGYLLPTAAMIWSDPGIDVLNMPAAMFLRVFLAHGLQRGIGRPVWRSVYGGGRAWLPKLLARVGEVRMATPVLAVRREPLGVLVETANGVDRFDAVVMATKAPITRPLLADADPDEMAVLDALRCRSGSVWLHTDRRLLPRRRKVWAASNYLHRSAAPQAACLSERVDQLQHLLLKTPLLLTVDPLVEPGAALFRAERRFPVLDHAATLAQARLAQLQGHRASWYVGAWTGDGLPETAVTSALQLASEFGALPDWARL
ncbi:NAD(P)-binding protein [Jeongeupia wiesaeckerbachi]|uniref:NAD(P)-binding protein n=1 Tax=Jeongeupia wiesaeckerbachi TaxID=3051218 RepID=UPI003D80794D